MFDNLFSNNIYKYGGDIERIDWIDNNSFFAVRNEMYGPACFLTNIKNKINQKVLDIEFIDAHYSNDFIYYTITKNSIMYQYNIQTKETRELFSYNYAAIFDIHDQFIYLSGSNMIVDEFDLNGNKINNDIKEVEHAEVKAFKDDYLYYNLFDFTYKDAYIYLGTNINKSLLKTDFKASEWSVNGDYLVVSTSPYTEVDVNPKIKVFKINEEENNFDLISEWNYNTFFVNYLSILNEYIYVIDRLNNFYILDLNCNILHKNLLKNKALCFSISPDNKKLAYAYGQYVEIIDISNFLR